MRLTTKGRYAVSAMLHLAMHNKAGPVPLAEVSDCQNISLSYVDQIFARLRHAGLVLGIPGPGGGYKLARRAEDITVGEVFAAVEGERRGKRASSPLEQAVWDELEGSIDGFLRQLSLADFVNRPTVRHTLQRQYRLPVWRCESCGAISYRSVCAPAAAS